METYSNFFRVDAKNAFMEIVPFAFPIGKVQMNFCQYEEQSKKMSRKLEIYLDFKEALYLSNSILSGRLDRKIAEAQKTGKFEGKDINAYTSYFTVMGGINLEGKPERQKKAKEAHPWLNSNYIARSFEVQLSTKYKYAFTLKYGNGKKEGNLIAMDGRQQEYVQIPITELDAIAMAKEIELNIQAYRTMFYMRFSDKIFPNLECNMFEPDSSKGKNTGNQQANRQAQQPKPQTQQTNQPSSNQQNTQAQEQKSAPMQEETPVRETLTFKDKDIAQPLALCKNSESKYALKVGNDVVLFEQEDYGNCKEWEDVKNSLTEKLPTKISFEVEVKANGYKYFKSLNHIMHDTVIKIKTTDKLVQQDNTFVVKSVCNDKPIEVVFDADSTNACGKWEDMRNAMSQKAGIPIVIRAFTEGNKVYFNGLATA